MRASAPVLLLVFGLWSGIGHAEQRVTGTYIVRAPAHVGMLQLTQSADGKLSGVASDLTARSDGKLDAAEVPVSGTVDNGQIVLKFGAGLSERTIAGAVNADVIHLQALGDKGEISVWNYERGTLDDFQALTARLKKQSQATLFSIALDKNAAAARTATLEAQKWTVEADTHARRLPRAKEALATISAKMESLLRRQRETRESVARSQVSVAVSQGDVAGVSADSQIDGVWDAFIQSGNFIAKSLASFPNDCGTAGQLESRGATPAVIDNWLKACRGVLEEGPTFTAAFTHAEAARMELKLFQKAEAKRRANLNAQSNAIN